MYEEVFKSTKPFQRCLVSSTLQKYCENRGKTIPFPQLPQKTTFWGKIGHFLGKSKKKKETRVKSKEKEKIIPLFLIKKNSFFPSLGKIVGILGKITPTTNILTLQIFIIRNKCLFLHYNSVKRFKRKWI